MTLKASGACAQGLHRTGENGDHILERHTQPFVCAGSQGKAETPWKSGLDLTAILRGTPGKTGACCEGRTLQEKLLGIFITRCSSGGCHFGKVWPHLLALRIAGQKIIQLGSQPHPLVNRLLKDPPGTQLPLISPRDKVPPTRGLGISPTHQ